MEIEYGLVVDYLFAWGVSRAKAAGEAVGAITDKAFQVTLMRLETVVRNRLGTNEAIEDLEEETAAAVAAPAGSSGAPAALSAGTHDSLVRSLERAARKTPDFAATLAEALTAVQAADPEAGTRGRSGNNTALGNTTSGPMSPIVIGDGARFRYGNYTAAPAAPSADAAGRQPTPPAVEENGGAGAGPTRPGTGHS